MGNEEDKGGHINDIPAVQHFVADKGKEVPTLGDRASKP